MLDTLEHQNTTTDLLDIAAENTSTTTAAPFTEEQALEYLHKITGPRPTIRALAAEWGWSKSRVDRFLSQHNGGTSAGQDTRSHEELRTLLINGGKAWDAKQPTAEEAADNFISKHLPQGQGAAEALVTTEQAITAFEKVLAGPANPKPADGFDWTDAAEDMVAPSQSAIAVYMNGHGQVVIRAERRDYEDQDQFIIVSREFVPTLIAKIRQVAESELA